MSVSVLAQYEHFCITRMQSRQSDGVSAPGVGRLPRGVYTSPRGQNS